MIVFDEIKGYKIFMGRDKFENDELIKWCWPEDVWFHVDNLSSAHVYVRMPMGNTDITMIPAEVFEAAAQLTKQNSIDGCKLPSVEIVYTCFNNLKKSEGCDVGAVGFKSESDVQRIKGVTKDKVLLKSLEKTKKEVFPDLKSERKQRDREECELRKALSREAVAKQRETERAKKEAGRSYFYGQDEDLAETTKVRGEGTIESCKALEEDFM